MNILVTGVAGHIGSNLCKYILGEGNFVVGVDNFVTGERENLKDLDSASNFTFIESAIEDPSLRTKLASFKFEEIYHLACPTGVPNLVTLAEEMLSATSVGTKNVLEIALKHKAKFLLASSSEVYGDPQVSPQGESYTGNVHPTGLRSPYEEGKRFSESLVAMFVQKYGLDAKIARIFNTYGPNMSDKDQRVIPRFLFAALENEPLTVHGDGSQKRTFLFVDDLITGLALVLTKGKSGEVYNIGSDKEFSILELANLISKITDSKSEIRFSPRPLHDHQSRMPSLEKIKKLGWQPKISLDEGLRRTVSYYKPAFIALHFPIKSTL